jgi:hypothetical protein
MSTPGEHGDTSDRAELEAQMRVALSELLGVAHDGTLSPSAFGERLGSIHARYLGPDVNAPAVVEARRKALAAYDELTSGRDRHHQLELIADALGIGPEPKRREADLDPRG